MANTVTGSSSVTALSHVSVQVFGHSHSRWFMHVPEETAKLQTKCFVLLPPHGFLLLLQSPVKTNQCDDLPIPTLFSLLFRSSPVLNMTLNCINYALCFMTTTDTWNEALVKIPWYRYNS